MFAVSGALLSVVGWLPAFAETPSAPTPELPEPAPVIQVPVDPAAIYDLVVNQAPRGEVVVYLRGEDVWIPWQDLVAVGLQDIGGDREIIAGVEHVSLQSLAPGITFERDDVAQTLRLQTPAAALAAGVIDFNPSNAPSGIIYSQPLSAYLNYGVNWQDFETLSAGGELVISFAGNAFASGWFVDAENGLQRGITNLVFDNPKNLTTLALGDAFVTTDTLGGGGLLGGISWGRNFELSPYLIRQPSFSASGVVASPAKAEVYLNNRLLRTLELPPGPFRLENLPYNSGFNHVRVVVTDAEGKTQVFDSRYVQFSRLLKPGLSEFFITAGAERQNVGTDNFRYDDTLRLLGTYRQGVLPNLTLGGRIEATEQLISTGVSVSTALPLGTMDVAAAVSSKEGVMGHAVAVSYFYPGRWLGFGGGVRLQSDFYANTSLPFEGDRPRLEGFFTASLSLGPRINLSGQYNYTDQRDAVARDQISLAAQVRLSRSLNLFIQASQLQVQSQSPENRFSVNLNYFLGGNTNLNAGWQQQGNQGVPSFSVQRYLPQGEGYGYRVQLEQQNEQGRAQNTFLYNAPWASYQLGYSRIGDTNNTLLGLEGAIVAIGGGLYLSRPIRNSFVLVDLSSNVPGVSTFLSNQLIGRTNRQGKVIIPNLIPYYGNQISIDPDSVPENYLAETDSLLIAPPFRGGSIARFTVQRIQNFIGTVVLQRAGTQIIPALGELTLQRDQETLASPLNRNGQFYFDTLAPGDYTAQVRFEREVCTFNLTIPKSEELFVELGTFTCVLP